MNIVFGAKKSKAKCNESDDDADEESEIYRENNHVYFYSEINRKKIQTLVKLLKEAEEYCIITSHKLSVGTIPIFLHISSLGGYIYSALIAVDVIQNCSIPVHSIVEGSVASAATLISIVCKKRYMLPNSHMMIHQLSSEMFGKMNELTDEYTNLTDTMNLLKTMYMKYAGFSKKKLEKLLSHDLMLNSKKAMKYKLVDELYVNSKSVNMSSSQMDEV